MLSTLFTFWPRATLKGPERSFVVVALVLLGDVEPGAKNVSNGTEDVCEQKCFQMEQKMCANKKCSKWKKNEWMNSKTIMELCRLEWTFVAQYAMRAN